MKAILASFLLGASALAAATTDPLPLPNILIILADDLGYGELSCQGNAEIPTPHIDSIATGGIRFTQGYVSGPYCSPTRAALLTGRYQQRYGHEFNPGQAQETLKIFGLPLEETTLADRLKAAGYVTGLFGKWHLGAQPGYHPLKRGFDEYFGFLAGAHGYLDTDENSANPILRGTTPIHSIDHTTEAFARETCAFIEKHASEAWFTYLSFNAVHSPLQSTEKYLKRFEHIANPKRRAFAAMLSAMDDGIGSVLAKLRELHLEENTLVFFLSDNGGPTLGTTSGNGPLRGYKTQTLEGGIRVPFMVQWKGHLPAGVIDLRPVIQLDLMPTVLAAAGVPVPADWKLDGVNLLPFLASDRQTGQPHDALYWRMGKQMAVRMGDWKLVKTIRSPDELEQPGVATTEGAELYNLATDIGETHNLAAEHPEHVRELAAAWSAWNRELVPPRWVPQRGKRY